MSYVKIMEYTVIPKETFKILRGCAGCGCKQIFSSKGSFRVNANGNRLDVWMIYGCEKCGHTYNLPIYERVNKGRIPEEEYRQFLKNDSETLFRFGTDKSVFFKNRVEIAWNEVEYEVLPKEQYHFDLEKEEMIVRLNNPWGLPVREDKVLAGILQITRSKVKKLLSEQKLNIERK